MRSAIKTIVAITVLTLTVLSVDLPTRADDGVTGEPNHPAARNPGATVPWYSHDAGGARGTSSSYQVLGTVGQPDASTVLITPGGLQLTAGFWQPFITPQIDRVSPPLLDSAGGTPIQIFGQGFGPGLTVRINGATVTNLVVIDQWRMTALAPANPAGTYDVDIIQTAAGAAVATLPEAVSYGTARARPIADLESAHLGDRIVFSWSNPLVYDQIFISGSDGSEYTLPGDATSFVVSPAPPDLSAEYTLTPSIQGEPAHASVATVVHPTINMTCEREGVDRLGHITNRSIRLRGDARDVAGAYFSTTLPYDYGFKLVALLKRGSNTTNTGALRADLYDISDPNITVATASYGDLAKFTSFKLEVAQFTGLLPAGDYGVRLYVDGGAPDIVEFEVMEYFKDGETLPDPGPPYPCPPYAAFFVSPNVCGEIPPVVSGIELNRVTEAENGVLGVVAEAIADDPDGEVVEYEWRLVSESPLSEKSDDSSVIARVTLTPVELMFIWQWYFTVPEYGDYNVRVWVRDNDGLRAWGSKTLQVYPPGDPPAAGQGPRVSHLSPDPNDGPLSLVPGVSALDPNTPAVFQEFRAYVQSQPGTMVANVSMELRDADDDTLLAPAESATTALTGAAGFWHARFNISALPRREQVVLRIHASDSAGIPSATDWLLTLSPIFDADCLNYVKTDLTYDPNAGQYDVAFTLPDDPNWFNCPITIPVIDVELQNRVVASFKTAFRLLEGLWSSEKLRGEIIAEFFSIDVLDKSWEANAVGEPTEAPEFGADYELVSTRKLHDTLKFDKYLLNDYPLYEMLFFRVTLDVRILAWYDTLLKNVLLNLFGDEPCVGLSATALPCGRADAEGTVKVSAVVAWVEGGAHGKILGAFPITLDYVPPASIRPTFGWCFKFNISWFARVCYDVWFSSGCEEIGGDLINTHIQGPGDRDTCSQIEPCDFGDIELSRPLRQANAPFHSPDQASSPDGQHTIAVWIDNGDPNGPTYKPDVFFKVDSGGGWSDAGSVWESDEHTDRDPRVVFVNDTTAVLLWIRNELTHAETAALTGDVAGLNTYFKSQEVYYAMWLAGVGWTPPQRVTNNTFAEQMPKLAADSLGRAWATWFRVDAAEPFLEDPIGDPVLQVYETSLLALALDPALGPIGPEQLITGDDAAVPAADYAGEVAFSPLGGEDAGMVVWVRERQDGTRDLMYSQCEAGMWTTPAVAYDGTTYPGIDMPSLALSSRDSAVVGFISDPNTTVEAVRVGLTGGELLAGHITRDGPSFNFTPPPTVNFLRCVTSTDPAVVTSNPYYARWPQVLHLGGNKFGVIARSMSNPRQYDPDGEVGFAVADFALPDATWHVANLTDDDQIDAEIGATVVGDKVRVIRTIGPELITTGVVDVIDFDLLPDLAIVDAQLSNRFAAPGQLLRVHVATRNLGFRSASASHQDTVVRVGYVDDASFVELGNVAFTFDVAPGEIAQVAVDIVTPLDVSLLRIQVDPLGEETVLDNNELGIAIGVQPPQGLTCRVVPVGDQEYIRLRWDNADIYDRILVYRDGQRIAQLRGDATEYADTDAEFGPHSWSLRGVVLSTRSPQASAICDGSVCPLGDLDCDGETSNEDLSLFLGCISGPYEPYDFGCELADMSGDGDVDLADCMRFQRRFSATAWTVGDLNCDGWVNNGDIDPFVFALSYPELYADEYPGCNIMLGDINGDGWMNNGDIDAFVELLAGQ